MKSFLELQSTVPTYKVVCEAQTIANCKIKFEFQISALNEKSAEVKADEIVKDLNLKDVTKNFIKL